MDEMVSKSRFTAHAGEYFRQVERTGQEVTITDRGRPVLKLIPYCKEPEDVLQSFRGTVKRYDEPMEPVGLEDWDALR